MSRDEIRGLEFDWYACDEVGHVALFASSGSALVPSTVLEATRDRDLLDERFRVSSQLHSEWEQLAEMGLFVYDCGSPQSEAYRLVATPTTPLLYIDLPADLAQAATRFRFPLNFETTSAIADEWLGGA